MGGAHHCSGPPVSEMTYTVSSGTLNPSIPYHTIPYHSFGSVGFVVTGTPSGNAGRFYLTRRFTMTLLAALVVLRQLRRRNLDFLHCALSLAAQCIVIGLVCGGRAACICGCVCVCVCGTVTTITEIACFDLHQT